MFVRLKVRRRRFHICCTNASMHSHAFEKCRRGPYSRLLHGEDAAGEFASMHIRSKVVSCMPAMIPMHARMHLPACVRRVPTIRSCCRNSLVHCATKKLCGPVAVQLEMPVGYRIHDVFYVSLIKPCKARPEAGAYQHPALVVEGNVYGAVNTILQHRQRKVGRMPLRAWLSICTREDAF